MTDEIILNYQLTPKEMISALQSRTRSGMFFRVAIVILVAVLVFFGIFIVLGLLKDMSLANICGSLVLTGAPILVFIGMFYADPLLARQVRRDPKLVVEQTWRFSDESIQHRTVHGESQSTWSMFTKASEDKQFFYLFLNERIFNVIPKRAIASPAEETTLRDLLRRKIPKWI